MKNILLSLSLFICYAHIYGQTSIRAAQIDVEITIEKRKALPKVEVKSSVPFTDSSWFESLKTDITNSIQSGKRLKKGTYLVSVAFILDKQGYPIEIACRKDPGFGMCERIMEVIKKSPKWKFSAFSFPKPLLSLNLNQT